MFRNGQLCVYELMDEDSAVRYWEGYGKIAFDAGKYLLPLRRTTANEVGQRSIYTTTTLKIPQSLTKHSNPHHGHGHSQGHGRPPDSDMSDAGSGVLVQAQESYREIKCCFSVTIRRDAWGVPVAIMGQWIVSVFSTA